MKIYVSLELTEFIDCIKNDLNTDVKLIVEEDGEEYLLIDKTPNVINAFIFFKKKNYLYNIVDNKYKIPLDVFISLFSVLNNLNLKENEYIIYHNEYTETEHIMFIKR